VKSCLGGWQGVRGEEGVLYRRGLALKWVVVANSNLMGGTNGVVVLEEAQQEKVKGFF